MRLVIALVATLIFCACHPTPTPLSPPDASDASALGDSPPQDDCQRGCAALAAAGCTLSPDAADCAAFLRVIDNGKEPNPATMKPLTCADVAAVAGKADAQRLGFVCPP
jgi:hypothetical protein